MEEHRVHKPRAYSQLDFIFTVKLNVLYKNMLDVQQAIGRPRRRLYIFGPEDSCNLNKEMYDLSRTLAPE